MKGRVSQIFCAEICNESVMISFVSVTVHKYLDSNIIYIPDTDWGHCNILMTRDIFIISYNHHKINELCLYWAKSSRKQH